MRLWVSRMKSFISDDWLFNCIWVIMSKVNCHYGVQQMPLSWKTVNSEDQLQAGCMLWLESYQYSMLMNYMTFASSSALWTIWCQKCWYRKGLFNMISVVTNNLEFSLSWQIQFIYLLQGLSACWVEANSSFWLMTSLSTSATGYNIFSIGLIFSLLALWCLCCRLLQIIIIY